MLLLPLRLVVALVVNLFLVPRNLVRALRRRPRWIALRLEGAIAERPRRRRFRFLGKPRGWTVAGLRALGERLAKDRALVGVVIAIDPLEAGWARIESVRDAVTEWRKSGKRVIAHISSGGSREYYLASACDEVLTDESGPLALTGLAAEAGFYGEALRRLGVTPELDRIGEYKSYAETFTRADMSPAHREALDAILDGVHRRLVAAIATGRRVTEERARELVDGGPYLPEAAKEATLVDAILYRDQVPARLGLAEGVRPASAERWLHARPRWWVPRVRRRRAVAVISLEGAIVPGEGSSVLVKSLGADAAVRAIAAVREDDRVAAAVLHVDSRGGSAAASDRIWREVERLGGKKPVVAYLGDVAASGGYYVVAPCARVVAQPSTLTGSIGVVAGKLSIGPLLEKLGVGTVVLTRGRAAGMMSVRRGFDDEERARLRREIDGTYHQFVAKVARGRKVEHAAIEPVARGRVWSGEDAKARGLVDELGGIERAIALARERGQRRAGERLDVIDVAPRPSQQGAGLRELVATATRERVLLWADGVPDVR